MKSIGIYDVAASTSGALAILMEYYEKAQGDELNEYHFFISTPQLKSRGNVFVHRFPWVKRSLFHRAFFEIFFAGKLSKKYKIDEIVSLQNIMVRGTAAPQTVYFHSPFLAELTEYRFRFREEPLFWIYQNILGPIMKRSLKESSHVIMQTQWMKRCCVSQYNIPAEKISVVRPRCLQMPERACFISGEPFEFFYPATPISYKNHVLLFKACILLAEKGLDFKVFLTISKNDALDIAMKAGMDGIPPQVICEGWMSREDVFDRYRTCALVFPSHLETWGMPISEAASCGSPLLLADCEYAHETAGDYGDVLYFSPYSAKDLANAMSYTIARFSRIKNDKGESE